METKNLSESYDGLAALSWDWMGGDDVQADFAFYRDRIAQNGGTALDLTCGTGRHLLRYLHAGLDVEGVDSSEAMLARCREKAQEQGLSPILYRQSMQALDLPRAYETVFISGGSFQLLSDRADASEALRRIHLHLVPGGQLLLETFVPNEASDSAWDARLGEHAIGDMSVWGPTLLPDGTSVTVQVRMDSIDRFEQIKVDTRRYERRREEELIATEMHHLHLRWYCKHELTLMLEQAGFRDIFVHGDYTNAAATAQTSETVYSARA